MLFLININIVHDKHLVDVKHSKILNNPNAKRTLELYYGTLFLRTNEG